ncbi:hypothetical protein SZ63_02445 [Methanoculleus sediminis]|uniref:BioF2-like acetyltransferase domain-containing protein n=1 Tax=Methanoculleus sediminis TaxID=1550566 RepID=A0A0H1R2R4_9EURY|nr:GNAT family N-acetyltransferase [Methanoculleus sediminis]KLK89304.1 hypothetical protein SZ63_02445 [Methanoculleus sediminis]
MRQPEVRELGSAEFKAWDALVAGSAQGTVFHTSDWLVENALLLDQTLILIGCYDGEELIGGCPLYLSRPYRLLHVASSKAVSTPYGGMVISDTGDAKQRTKEVHTNRIIAAILEHITRQGFDYVDLVNAPGLEDIRAFTQQGWSPAVYYTYVLPTHNDLFKTASKDVRQNIRKARRLDISSARIFDPDIFWNLLIRTFSKQGKEPPVTERHLTGMLKLIREKGIGEMRVASMPSGEIAAAEVTLWDAKMAHSLFAAASPEHLSTGAATLLCYDNVNSLKERNHRMLNLMAGNIPHLSAFISGFNPRLIPYYGAEYPRFRYRILKRLKDGVYPDNRAR